MTKREKHKETQSIYNQIAQLEQRCMSLRAEIWNLRIKAESLCPHIYKIENDEFIEGSYYDLAEYHHKTFCKTCGVELNDRVTKGGYG